jgi:hypothetical protein
MFLRDLLMPSHLLAAAALAPAAPVMSATLLSNDRFHNHSSFSFQQAD